jgi:hypothetical protein
MPYKNDELSPLLEADLANCQIENAPVTAHPAGGVTYSVVCREIGDELGLPLPQALARLSGFYFVKRESSSAM